MTTKTPTPHETAEALEAAKYIRERFGAKHISAIERFDIEIDTVIKALQSPPRPAIKKLEWVMSREGGQIYHDAKTSFGTYSIEKQSDYWLYLGDDCLGSHGSLKAAKAAAEAHKDKTIRGCLV